MSDVYDIGKLNEVESLIYFCDLSQSDSIPLDILLEERERLKGLTMNI